MSDERGTYEQMSMELQHTKIYSFTMKEGGDIKAYICACCEKPLRRDAPFWRCDNPDCTSRWIGTGKAVVEDE